MSSQPLSVPLLPKTQKAAVKQGHGASATTLITEIPVPQPGAGQILVKINYSGLCSSDKSLFKDEWEAFGVKMFRKAAGIVGHEGAGQVVALAPDVAAAGSWKLGDRAGIKFIADVCEECSYCRDPRGEGEVNCPKQLTSGMTSPGTFQEYCLASARYATRLPDGVSDEEAGPVMCGGVTAYVACKRSGVRPGEWLVVLGSGGGLGHLAVQYGRALGMKVIAVDGGEAKREFCMRLGAVHYLDFTVNKSLPKAVAKITGDGAHGVVVMTGAKASYASAALLLRPGGTMVAVGLPGDPRVLAGAPPMLLAMKRLSAVGSLTGTRRDVQEALGFTARGEVRPMLTMARLEDLDELYEKMGKGQLVGRAVIKVASDANSSAKL